MECTNRLSFTTFLLEYFKNRLFAGVSEKSHKHTVLVKIPILHTNHIVLCTFDKLTILRHIILSRPRNSKEPPA